MLDLPFPVSGHGGCPALPCHVTCDVRPGRRLCSGRGGVGLVRWCMRRASRCFLTECACFAIAYRLRMPGVPSDSDPSSPQLHADFSSLFWAFFWVLIISIPKSYKALSVSQLRTAFSALLCSVRRLSMRVNLRFTTYVTRRSLSTRASHKFFIVLTRKKKSSL